jgi:hypothetical protein
VNLTEAREKLAAVLAPVADADPDVLVSLVDSIEPPALMIGWGDPMLESDTSCFMKGRLVITAVASRLMPGAGVAKTEDLIAYVRRRLQADTGAWPIDSVTGPRRIDMAKTTYIAVHITVRVPITI